MEQIQSFRKWILWGIFNLSIVALFGALMRYKIAFDFPLFQQKNLLHAHSHFAFAGWITHVLYSGLTMLITPYITQKQRKRHTFAILFNLFVAFGMLISFTIQGYKAVSITFSTLSIVVAIYYAYIFIKDSQVLPQNTKFKPWAIAGLLINIIAALGPLYLAYMMASKTITHNYYLGSIYYYLHFQYNGWFFFASMALIVAWLPNDFPDLKKYFNLFVITVIPTYLLSILWAKLPTWLYVITVIMTFIQMYAWLAILYKSFPIIIQFRHNKNGWANIFFYGATFAMTIKFILQTISIIPSLSHLVFGLRSIVIAYIHLILLGVYSLFIIGYAFHNQLLKATPLAKFAAFSFLIGVVLNEAVLGIQGMAAFTYTLIPLGNESLFIVASILFLSALTLGISQLIAKKAE
ncbi:MAG: hypothetical protein LC105_00380 [Chitinophagales bacterium]|nr:hypothetical protein [Chitinophagales bacterium]MCZ2392301.1 hypothetical protein [Chitinophagales bacterium]